MPAESLYLIEIAIQARDRTSAAVSSALQKLGLLDKELERQQRRADETGKAYDRLGESSQKATRKISDDAKALGARTEAEVKAMAKLEEQVKRLAKTRADTSGDVIEREARELAALEEVGKAEKNLADAYNETQRVRKKAQTGSTFAAQVRENTQLIAQDRERAALVERNARAAETNRAKDLALAKATTAQEIADIKRVYSAHAEAARNKQALEREYQQLITKRVKAEGERDRLSPLATPSEQGTIDADISRVVKKLEFVHAQLEDLDDKKIDLKLDVDTERLRVEGPAAIKALAQEAEQAEKDRRQAAKDQAKLDEENFKRGEAYLKADAALRAQIIRDHQQAAARQEQSERRYQQLVQQRARLAIERAKISDESPDAQRVRVAIAVDDRAAKLEMRKLAVELFALTEKKRHIKIDVDTARARLELASFKRAADDTSSSGNRLFAVFGLLRNSARDAGKVFEQSGQRVAGFDNLLRGLMTLGIAVFLQQLVQIGGGVVGMLFALAASAVQAGAALGGSLSAGLLQAMPVLGVFATALSRVKGVMDAVKQANLLEEQQSYKSEGTKNQQAKSLENVRRAQEGLTKARRDAVRQIQDLILAERSAQLAAEGAALSQKDAQAALQAAIASGGDVERAQLQVKEADLGVEQADRGFVKARAARVEGTDPEKTEGVRNAKRALKDARQSAQETQDSVSAAKGKLDFLLSQMSTAEVALYKALVRLQKRFHDFAKDISEPIIERFTDMANRVTRLLGDNRIVDTAKKLSGGIADAMGGIFDSFTSNKSIGQFQAFAEDARKNLGPVERIIKNLGHAFIEIGRLASKPLSDLLTWLADLSRKFRDFTQSASGRNYLRDYFRDGVKALKEWAGLLGNIIKLFLAISGAGGAATGTSAVSDLSDAVGKAADTINDKGSKANKFFRDFFKTSREVIDAVIPIIKSLAREFKLTFEDNAVGSVQAFAHILANVIIPAIGRFVRTIGEMTTSVGTFAKEHPGLTKIAANLLGILLVFTTLSKVGVLFTPVLGIFKFLGSVVGGLGKLFPALKFAITDVATSSSRFAGIFGRILEVATKLRPIILGPWGLLAGVLLIVLAKLGLLDDLFRAFGRFFTGLWDQIKPPFERLFASFGRLSKAVSDGSGAFGPLVAILKVVLKIAIEILGFFLEGFGRSIGKVIGGVIDVLAGLMDIVTGLLTGDWKLAWKGAKEIVSGVVRAIIGILELVLLKGVGKIFGKLGGAAIGGLRGFGRLILNLFKDAGRALITDLPAVFRGVLSFFRKLPGGILDVLKNLPTTLKEAFKNGGKAIVNGLIEGVKLLKDELPKVLREIIGKMPGGGVILKALDKIGGVAGKVGSAAGAVKDKFFAAGGPVPGSGDGDIVSAMLTPGEHVLTRAEVAAAGGHSVIFALRRMLGGGGQGGPRGYATGGATFSADNDFSIPKPSFSADNDFTVSYAKATAARKAEQDDRRKDLETTREDYKKSNSERAQDFRTMWNDMLTTARRASNDIQAQVREMRTGIAQTISRLVRDTGEQMTELVSTMSDRAASVVASWRGIFSSISDVTHEGLTYIGHETNKVLKALGASTVNFNLSTPSTTSVVDQSDRRTGGHLAVGGFVGNPGERGRDAVATWLGRGEAVLNWGQQKAVNAAMRGQDTLSSVIARSRGYHAGGPGQPGYATGGGDLFDGHPSNVNASVRRLIDLLKDKFSLSVTSTTDHGLTRRGTRSDHQDGNAVDLGGSIPVMKRAADYVKSSGLYKSLKQGIHNPNLAVNAGKLVNPSFYAGDWAGHVDHIHLAITGAIDRLAAGATSNTIGKLTVRGGGALRRLAQRALDQAVKSAGAAIDSAGNLTADSGTESSQSLTVGPGGSAEKVFDYFARRGLSDEAAAGIAGTIQKESNFSTTVLNKAGSGATGLAQWLGGRLSELKRRKNWQSFQTQLDYIWYELRGSENAALRALRTAKTPAEAARLFDKLYERSDGLLSAPANAEAIYKKYHGKKEFADGGIIPGGSGQPVPILAHAGEWVLNAVQQSKIARALGTGIGQVRNYLGFSGGPTSFAGGGEVQGFGAIGKVLSSASGLGIADAILGIAGAARDLASVFVNLGDVIKSPDAIRLAMRTAAGAIKKLLAGKVTTSKLKSFTAGLEIFTADTSGLLNALNTAIETRSVYLANTLALAQQGFKRVRNAIKRMTLGEFQQAIDPLAVALEQEKDLKKTGDGLASGRRFTAGRLTDLNRVIAALRKQGVPDDDSQMQILIGKQAELEKFLADYDTKLAQNYSDRFEATKATFEARFAARASSIASATSTNDASRRIRSAFGLGTTGNDTAALAIAEDNRKLLQDKLADATRRARKDPRWKEIADGLAKELASASADVAEATHNALQGQVDGIVKRFEDRAAGRDISTRLATLTGDQGTIAADLAAGIGDMYAQAQELQDAAWQAHQAGDLGLQAELQAKIDAMRAGAREKTAEMIQQAADAAEAAFGRAEARRAISGRAADLIERAGNRGAAILRRQGISAARVGDLTTERNSVEEQFKAAQNAGLTVLAESLATKFEDLSQSIDEENQTRAELVFQYRQASIDLITGRTSRVTGLIGAGQTIFEKINALTGASGNADSLRFAKQQQTVLQGAHGDIATDVGAAAGDFGLRGGGILTTLRDAFNTSPGSFANKLAELGPTISSLESTMGDTQKTSFQALIQAMIDNTTETLDNTQSINTLNGTMAGPQTFATSAWSLYREAIFNGMGDVLPQYAVPHMATGGAITKGGIFELHPGEFVVNPQGTNIPDGDVNITMNAVDGHVDLTALASRIAFAKKSRV